MKGEIRLCHPLVLIWGLWTLVVIELWLILFSLRLDNVIQISYRVIWVPVWLWIVSVHYLIWWVMGAPRDRVLCGSWRARRTSELVAAFVDPLLAAFAISNVLLVLKWDYLYFLLNTVIAAPLLVYAIIAFITACLTLQRRGLGSVAGVFILYWLGSIIFLSARSDWIVATSWLAACTLIFWVPNALIFATTCVFWAVEQRRVFTQSKSGSEALKCAAFYLGIAKAILLLGLCQFFVCSKADGWNESMSWAMCFAPAVAAVGLFFAVCASGLFLRLRSDRRLFTAVSKEQFESEQARLFNLLNAVFDHHLLSPTLPLGRDLLILLKTGMSSDLTLVVEGKPIFVHSVILHARRRTWDVFEDLQSGRLANTMESSGHRYLITQKNLSYNQLFAALAFLYSAQPQRENTFLAIQRLFFARPVKAHLTSEQRLVQDMTRLLTREGEPFSDTSWSPMVESHLKPKLLLHKSVLSCRSPFFKALFSAGLRESRAAENPIPTDTTYNLFRTLVQSVYTGQIDVADSELLRLLEIAHRYQVEDTLGLVQRRLAAFVSVLTLVDLADAAVMISLSPFVDFCTCYALIFWDSLPADVRSSLPQQIKVEINSLREAGCSLGGSSTRRLELLIMSKFPAQRDDNSEEEASSSSSSDSEPEPGTESSS